VLPDFVAPPEVLAQLTEASDRMLAMALHCDVTPLAPEFREMVESARSTGGYGLTHAFLALILLEELGCGDELDESLRDRVAEEVAAISTPEGPVDDLAIEAEAFLGLGGHRDLLEPGFAMKLIGVQTIDGGFAASGNPADEPSWHTGGLALWVLLESRFPAAAPRASSVAPGIE
jgi:hypothetical protein